MKKTKKFSQLIIVLFLLLPFVKVSPAQESYVGIQDGDEYLWWLSIYRQDWWRYFRDDLEGTLGNLWPLGSSNMTTVYWDWVIWSQSTPPQSRWPFNIISIGTEETGTFFSPFDNTTITSTPVNATAGWILSTYSGVNSIYNGIWYIVNDTSSFLRQTLNLTLSFSPYSIMSVPFAPINIDWSSFVSEFLGVMNSKGGLYNNISATALSNGYTLIVPARGFENNSGAIEINVEYNHKGQLRDYEFSYGEKLLVKYWSYVLPPPPISEGEVLTIVYGGIAFVTIVLIILGVKKIHKRPVYVGA
ncbi:hypothetical protein LCGC14_0781940 [marine sediment metagenome]|uniref:Uncharacterized protein n=1 Tax=marine sediment metagenome TaxID=412755 RepID=A0A0F9PVG2_9ZZZZ|nr:MAG: hypothetical protein Lokiarch_09540 [Candidatus Lokiarchaeum sp. GC14_75]